MALSKRECRGCGARTEKMRVCPICSGHFSLKWYYCSKECQMSDWKRHRACHGSLTKLMDELSRRFTPVNRFLSDKFDGKALIDCARKEGRSALHLACEAGSVATVKALIKAGDDELLFRTTKSAGCTCLLIAAANGHTEIVKVLIAAGGKALLYMTCDFQLTCLHYASKEGHLDTAKALVEAGGEQLLHKTTRDGYTCLHLACGKGNLEIAKFLIEAGGDALLFKKDTTHGYSCLHVASCNSEVAVLEFLLERYPALVGLRGLSGRTALDLAVNLREECAEATIRAALGQLLDRP